MGLIEDLIANNYLITPSAFYLLQGPYEEGTFALAQLVKFAKSRGTFVIDSPLAEEFLDGLVVSTESADEGALENADDSSPVLANQTTPETSDFGEESGNGSVTAVSASYEPHLSESVEDIPPSNSDFNSSISTGDSPENIGNDGSDYINREISSEIQEGGSFVSTGTDGPGDEVVAPTTADEDEPSPPVVYGDYGVPIAYEEEVPEDGKSYSAYSDVVITPREGFVYRAKEIKDDWEVTFDVKNVKFEPPKAKNAAGKEGEIIVKAYSKYFKSRLRKMRRILRDNPEVGSVIDISKLSYVRPDEDVTIIGLINSKRETRKGYMFEVEDSTGIMKVFINRNNEDSKKFFQIMPDSVVAFRGRYSGRNIFFADKLYLPDVPMFKREKPPLEEKVYAILLSDIHVGSNKFCEKAFERFLAWLNGEVNNKKEEELVSRVKYLIIAGDVVDGVGIYPGQYNELEIPDIFDQYEAFANLMRNVPDHIVTFIGPGNHDAARTALPQPGFYEEYTRPLRKLKNTVIISNPAVINLHGREFLIAHGRGIEDVVNVIPNRTHHRPAEAMLDLLKLRHLAPTFGEKVPIAPDPEDTLVIESVPDLFQAGHVHVMEYRMYNGVFLINSGTWQAQTEFQKMVNIVPTPARVPIIDVETARLRAVVRFDQFCEGV